MHTHDDWASVYKAAGLHQGVCGLHLLWQNLEDFGFTLPDLNQAMRGETLIGMSGQLPSDERWHQIGKSVCNDPDAAANDIVERLNQLNKK